MEVIEKDVAATSAVLELALESWKFQKLFMRAMSKMDMAEAARFSNQHRYFIKRIGDCLGDVGIRFVNIEGHPYDAGTAVTALNLSDFDPDDALIVSEMIEPIVMNTSGLVRAGTVMLKRAGA
ncbi:hypothetical protein [Salinarimonas soli]|uniref:Uncharacterized protein n=1 Tax=Salinarimonas soli TaxID=1638099 RepID=A0A5B2VBP7_9HYPH|nr:hypothetical protein [Salinarimonas soli]KAA2235880.1 hypothetical protein F0L46_17735 [Salinarimonas soli]